MLVFLALLGLSGLSQAAMLYEVFRLQGACVALYPVFAALMLSQRHRFQTTTRILALCLSVGLYLGLLLLQFPYASSLHPLVDGPKALYVESSIPFFQGHRFNPEDAERYEHLSRLLCDGRSRIANMTPDSTIPYLCPGQQNALGLPFFIEGLTLPADAKHLEELRRGVLRPDELMVTEILPPRNLDSRWKEIGQVLRPMRRHASPSTLHVLRAASAP
jgi:hypothetical protein